MVDFDYELVVIGSGPAGQKAAIQAAKLRRQRGSRRAAPGRRRELRQHGHDPVEDDPGGDPLPHGPEPARDLRRRVPVEGGDLDRGSRVAHALRRRARAGRHPRPAPPQPRHAARGHRRVSSTSTRLAVTDAGGASRNVTAANDRDRERLRARASAGDRLQRQHDPRLGRHRPSARTDPGTIVVVGARRDRDRVRVDVRRARRAGRRSSTAGRR